jgi:flagellar biosynthesis protein FlhF
MHIRTFRAASLQDALDQIRQQMGPDASVLHTRQVRDGWMGWLGRTYVEVTAGLRDQHDQSPVISIQRSSEVDSRPAAQPPTYAEANPGQASTTHASRFAVSQPDPSNLGARRGIDPSNLGARPELDHGNFAVGGEPDHSNLPLQLQAYREELMAIDVDPATVQRWLSATISFAANLGDSPSGSSMAGTPWLEHLQRSVARELLIGSPIRTQPGDRRVVALVGPTGVGKTTTVAKLAAGFRIEARRRVGLLTIDTFRIAAVQQLKAYAEIMDLPMEVVEKPEDMRPALERLGDVDLVLIDTAGRSPRSDARIDQLVELLRSAQPDETHLVLSSTSSASSIRSALRGFGPVRPTAAILTKLDETPHTAGVMSAIVANDRSAGVPLSYTTNGQQVPDDIATADASSLLSRLLPARLMAPQMEAA